MPAFFPTILSDELLNSDRHSGSALCLSGRPFHPGGAASSFNASGFLYHHWGHQYSRNSQSEQIGVGFYRADEGF
jgi:hypothetical protein